MLCTAVQFRTLYCTVLYSSALYCSELVLLHRNVFNRVQSSAQVGVISRGASLSLGQYTLDNISEADVDTYIQVMLTIIYMSYGHLYTIYVDTLVKVILTVSRRVRTFTSVRINLFVMPGLREIKKYG